MMHDDRENPAIQAWYKGVKLGFWDPKDAKAFTCFATLAEFLEQTGGGSNPPGFQGYFKAGQDPRFRSLPDLWGAGPSFVSARL